MPNPAWFSIPEVLRRAALNGTAILEEDMAALDDDQRAQLDQQARAAAWLKWAARIGVPVRLMPASFATAKRTPVLLRSEAFMGADFADGRCLVLTGPTGVGKTWSAVAALRAAGYGRHRFWYFPALCSALLDPSRRADALESVKTDALVVFDDFGVEYVKEGGILDTFLDEIIWHREAAYLATIITTNLTTEGLKARLSDRLVDRLRGDWGRIFECPGESLRGVEV